MRINVEGYNEAYKTLETEIRNDLFDIFNKKENEIKSIIATTVSDNVSIDASVVNAFTQAELMEVIYNEQIRISDLVCEKVDTITSYTKNIIERAGATRGSSWFNVLRNELTRNINTSRSIEEILDEFIKSIPRFLSTRLGREIDEDILFRIMAEAKTTLKPIIYDACDKVKETLNEKINDFVSKFNMTEKNDITEEDINSISKVADYLGYKIKSDNNKTCLVKDDNEIPLIKQTNQTLVADDITFSLPSDDLVIASFGRDVLTVGKDYIAIGTEADPRNMEIEEGFMEYTFSCAGENLTDPLKIGLIISTMRRRYPNLYKDMIANEAFREIVTNVSKAEKDNEKIIIKDNMKSLNPNKREELNNYLQVIGYEAEERDGNVYLIDQFGEEYPVEYNNGAIILPNEVQIATDFYMVGSSGIKGPDIYYKDRKNQVTLFYAEDFSQIDLIVGEGHFRVTASESGINYHSRIDNIVAKDEDRVTEAFNKYFPAVLAKLKSTYQKAEESIKTDELLKELDETPSEVSLETQEPVSVDDRIFELMQDPKVQEYIALKEEQERLNEQNSKQRLI